MNYQISGKVIKGDGYGRKLGFPTVNLATEPPSDIKEGVYAGEVLLEGHEYRAGIVVRPDDRIKSRIIEAHLIGFEGDAYGKEVTIKIEKFLREYKNFDLQEALISQIKEDLEQC